MAKEIHQRVDADLGFSEFGGERVPQPIHERAFGAVAIDARPFERTQHPMLQRAASEALPVESDEQRRSRRPRRESPGGGGAAAGRSGKLSRPRIEVAFHRLDERRFDGNAPIFASLAVNVYDRTILGEANVGDVGAQQFLGAQARKQRGQDQRSVPFDPVRSPGWTRIVFQHRQQCGHRIRG